MFIDIYISIVHGPVAEYVEVLGFFRQMKKIYIIGAAVNIILSIIGAKTIGVEGVFFATVVSQVIMWVGRSRVVFSEYFADIRDQYRYWRTHMFYVVNFLIVYYSCMQIMKIVKAHDHFTRFVSGGFICLVVALIDIVVFWGRSKKFNYLKDSLLGIFEEKIMKKR